MTRRKTRLLTLLIAIVVMIGVFVSCGKDNEHKDTAVVAYQVTVKSEGGMPLSDLKLRVYGDETKENLVWAGETDKEGIVNFNATISDKYIAVLDQVPEGYEAKEAYPLAGTESEVILDMVFTESNDLTDVTYQLGNVIRDFSITAVDGSTYKISQLLEEKQAVVLNFWFLNCGPCKMEFPYMQQAYEEFQDDIEIIAINPLDGTVDSITTFATDMGLTFPMAVGDNAWESCMKLTAYPTTVVIDRYGTISMIHKGSITDKETFTKIFEYFTSDGYEQITIRNISDIE